MLLLCCLAQVGGYQATFFKGACRSEPLKVVTVFFKSPYIFSFLPLLAPTSRSLKEQSCIPSWVSFREGGGGGGDGTFMPSLGNCIFKTHIVADKCLTKCKSSEFLTSTISSK